MEFVIGGVALLLIAGLFSVTLAHVVRWFIREWNLMDEPKPVFRRVPETLAPASGVMSDLTELAARIEKLKKQIAWIEYAHPSRVDDLAMLRIELERLRAMRSERA